MPKSVMEYIGCVQSKSGGISQEEESWEIQRMYTGCILSDNLISDRWFTSLSGGAEIASFTDLSSIEKKTRKKEN